MKIPSVNAARGRQGGAQAASLRRLLGCGLLILLSAWVCGQEKASPSALPSSEIRFLKEIAPIFIKKCMGCHGPDKSKGGYRLHTFQSALTPGKSEKSPIVPSQPEESHLYQLITAEDEEDRMPQNGDALAQHEIDLIRRWIAAGAPFEGSDPDRDALLTAIAFRPPHPMPPTSYPRPVPIRSLAFRVDGQELAAGGYHEITIWNPLNGELLRRITNVSQQVHALAFHPQKQILACASGAPGLSGEIALYDAERGSLIQVLGTMTDLALSVCFNSDGSSLAAGGTDNAIHLYDPGAGTETRVIQQHADWVMALRFHPEGGRIASASRDRTARIYDAQTGQLELTYNEHKSPVWAIAFGQQTNLVFSAGGDPLVHVWNFSDAKKTAQWSGFEGEIYQLIVAGDHLFSCSSDKNVRQHSISQGKLVRTYAGHLDWVFALAFDPAHEILASGSYDGRVRVWNIKDGGLICDFVAAPGIQSPTHSLRLP